MIYLIVGVDRHTLTPWHENIRADDVTAASWIAQSRAHASGVNLVVAAVIGPDSTVIP